MKYIRSKNEVNSILSKLQYENNTFENGVDIFNDFASYFARLNSKNNSDTLSCH